MNQAITKAFTVDKVTKMLTSFDVIKIEPSLGDVNAKLGFLPLVVKGVHVTFANGISVSVQWGRMNYCDHGEKSCEVMAMDSDGYPVCIPNHLEPYHSDQVVGHVTVTDLADIFQRCCGLLNPQRKDVFPSPLL